MQGPFRPLPDSDNRLQKLQHFGPFLCCSLGALGTRKSLFNLRSQRSFFVTCLFSLCSNNSLTLACSLRSAADQDTCHETQDYSTDIRSLGTKEIAY